MPSPCEPCKDSCKDGACKDDCSCKDKGCNDCSSKGKSKLEEAAAKMDRDHRRQSTSRRSRLEHSLKTCFPVSFSVVFLITIILFYCLI